VGRSKIIRLLAKIKVEKKLKSKHKKKAYSAEQKTRRNTRTAALALWALGSLCLLVLLGQLITLLTRFYNPLTPSMTDGSALRWDGKSSFSVAVKVDTLAVVNYDPVNRKLTVLKIPDETFLSLPKGYGGWPARSIFDLGQAEHPAIGSKLVRSTLSNLLGIPVEGFILIPPTKGTSSLEQVLAKIHHGPLGLLLSLNKIQSDRTGAELVRLVQGIEAIREDNTKIIDLADSSITESKLLADSTRVLGVNTIKLDLYIRENFKDSNFVNFDGGIAIFNATNHPGLAQDLARVITNMGGNVISLSNTSSNIDTSLVLASPDFDPINMTYQRLAALFAPTCLKSTCESSDPRVLSSRAQINIVLGEDYYLKKNDRNYPF